MEILGIDDWGMLISLVVALLGTGVIAGILAGLLGVGGGIVIVPVLFHIFTFLGIDEAVRMHVAVGTSLATIIPTSISSARAHYRHGGVDLNLLKSWGPLILIGVLVGTYIGTNVKGEVLTAVFAVVALAVAANMVFRPEGFTVLDHLPRPPFKQLIAVIIGGFSVMMGIGGGTLTVPILSACNYPIRRAVGTASAIGLIIALPGVAGFLWKGLSVANLPPGNFGYVNLFGLALIAPVTVLTAPVGAHIAHTINPGMLKKAFAFFLFLTSIRMFYGLLAG